MTAVDEARRALGARLRALRKSARLTGKQLAEVLSWPPSKISKLETGRQAPTDEDIRSWANACRSDSATEGLLAALHTLEEQHAEWHRVLRSGLRAHQEEMVRQEARVRLFRIFQPVLIPGLLQTADYARKRLAVGIGTLFDVPNDVDSALRIRMQRQEILYRSDKRFHFILTEAALRNRLCPTEVLLAQLDRLVAASAMSNVRLGVIGFDTECELAPLNGFWLEDSKNVSIETFSAELNLAQPQEIELYSRVFDQMAAVASYGREARAIITRVIDELSTEPGEDGS